MDLPYPSYRHVLFRPKTSALRGSRASHSVRSTSIGSTLDARRAGTQLATSATAASTPIETARLTTSIEETPYSRSSISRPSAIANRQAGRAAEDGEAQALAEDQPPDVAGHRAERHPNADLPGALADRVRHRAVQAHGGEDQRGQRERESDGHRHPFVVDVQIGLLAERERFGDRDSRIDRRERLAKGVDQRRRIAGGSDVDHACAGAPLREWTVEARARVFPERAVLHVAGHAHHFDGRIGEPALVKDLSNRRSVRPVPPGHRFVHDRDERPALDVTLAQRPARQ